MGVDWTAYTFVGCKIDDPHVTKKVRCCHHEEISNAAFCPQCGKRMWETSVELSPILQQIEETKGGFEVFQSYPEEEYYVALNPARIKSVGSHKHDYLKLNPHLEEGFKTILKTLYNPKNFGIWTVLCAG